ncbi:hypothetical protein ACP70R_022028 [Stipagrostis hirtigluma subsp. patula]
MGLCLSVALWKEKLCADGDGGVVGRRGVKGGVCEYGVLGGDVLEAVEEEKVVVSPVANVGVKRGADQGPAVAGGGTPARPIWQRRVLMGGKCRLPRFSGMILYDESGRPVCSGIRDRACDQEKHAVAISVLRDML